jgi:hypothetical protein
MRICEGCRREYVPKSGKQRFCSLRCPGRVVRPRRGRSYVPEPGEVRSCDLCGAPFSPVSPNQRFCSLAHQRIGRRQLEAALYNHDHKALRARLAPVVATGTVICSWPGCGEPILPGEPWDLGHSPDGRWAGAQHARCNRKTEGRLPSRRGLSRVW